MTQNYFYKFYATKSTFTIECIISLFSYAVPTIATNVNEHYFLATIVMSTKIPGWVKNDN